ncbi:MAG TPA: hypothetical protein VM144_04845 [Aestuariivirga sp.]|nr:hypothetical protein [Aestuariivirga sp.]
MDLMPRVIQQKYSIHASNKSQKGINYIHHTMVFDNNTKRENVHVTKAIKNKENFAFLFCRRCSDLRKPEYLTADDGVDNKSLGNFDPDFFTLFYAVMACSVEERADIEDLRGGFYFGKYNQSRQNFRTVSLIILWTFLSLPTHRTSLTYHKQTVAPENTTNPDLDKGLTVDECIAEFLKQCSILEEEQRNFVIAEGPPLTPGQPISIPIERYFQIGNADMEEAEKHRKMLTLKVLTL